MPVQVLFFAAVRDLVGLESAPLTLPAAGLSVDEFALLLSERFPALSGNLHGVRFAINEDFADDGSLVHGGDTVALIPPTAGG